MKGWGEGWWVEGRGGEGRVGQVEGRVVGVGMVVSGEGLGRRMVG